MLAFSCGDSCFGEINFGTQPRSTLIVRFDLQIVRASLDVRQSHAGAETEFARQPSRGRPAFLHRLFHVLNARTDIDRFDAHLVGVNCCGDLAAERVDDDIRLSFIGDHRRAPPNLRGDTALAQYLSHSLGKLPRAVIITCAHVCAYDDPVGGIVSHAFRAQGGLMCQGFFGATFEVLHQTPRDVATGEDTDQTVVPIEYGKTTELVAVELCHGTHEREVVTQRDHVAGHVLLHAIVDVAFVERADDVLNTDEAEQVVTIADRHTGDATCFH